MASLLRIEKSPFWYLSFLNNRGRWQKKSTKLRADDPNENAAAELLLAKAVVKEKEAGAHQLHETDESAWHNWVVPFLSRHCETEYTLERYLGSWKWLALWLRESALHSPRDLKYRHAVAWMTWRTTFKKRKTKAGEDRKPIHWNTARNDLKVLAIIMGEALALEFIDANPLASLRRIKKLPAKEKPELTDDDILFFREKLREEPLWMQRAFEISLYTNCRLRETVIPMSRVDMDAGGGIGKIKFIPKGGRKKAYAIAMPSALRPMFEAMVVAGETVTLTLPFQPSRRWGQFLEKIGRPELTFHCLKVTSTNRRRKAGVPREMTKRFANHSSEQVHDVYQREQWEDTIPYRDQIQLPGQPSAALGVASGGNDSTRPETGDGNRV